MQASPNNQVSTKPGQLQLPEGAKYRSSRGWINVIYGVLTKAEEKTRKRRIGYSKNTISWIRGAVMSEAEP